MAVLSNQFEKFLKKHLTISMQGSTSTPLSGSGKDGGREVAGTLSTEALKGLDD